MAIFRILRKLYSAISTSSIPQNDKQAALDLPKSSSKPGVVPNSPSNSLVSQTKNLIENKKIGNQMAKQRMILQRQNMINQKSQAELAAKSKRDQEKRVTEAQKIEETRNNNQNKLQVSLNNNRPDMGKVMPAGLVKNKTIPSETKSVK